jgi:hypothetical protein
MQQTQALCLIVANTDLPSKWRPGMTCNWIWPVGYLVFALVNASHEDLHNDQQNFFQSTCRLCTYILFLLLFVCQLPVTVCAKQSLKSQRC